MENSNQKSEVSQKTVMGILAYLGILVVIPYMTSKEDPFVKFHIRQGLVLLVIEVVIWLLGMVFWPLWILLNLVNLAVLVLAIMGIVNVVKNQEKKLPLVGDYAKYFNI
jgi:uncharacterized membrane protein